MDRAGPLRLPTLAVALAVAAALAACQTKPPAAAQPEPAASPSQAVPAVSEPALTPAKQGGAAGLEPAPTPEPSAIGPAAEGFWPAPESRSRTMGLDLLIGNPDILTSWQVEIVAVRGGAAAAVKTFAGAGAEAPSSLSWDGLGQDGKPAREGSYAAILSADYAGLLPRVALRSKTFALSLSPPEPVIYATPSRLEPSPAGIKKSVTFELAARAALAGLDSWRLDLVGPDGRLFRSFEGDWPSTGSPPTVSWDGRGGAGADAGPGAVVEPGKRYSAILSVRDVYGHAGSAQASLAVADLPYAPERSSVQPWTAGFSPNADGVMDVMDLSLNFGQRAAIRSWRLEIAHADRGLARSYRGAAPELPASIAWDGLDNAKLPAPEGRYVATLYVDYGSTFSPSVARSPSFVLDASPPALSLNVSPALFSPELGAPAAGSAGAGPSGAADSRLSIRLAASSPLARVSDWSVEILDPGSRVFARFGGAWPAGSLSWDGLGSDGSLVESAESYRVVARVRDEFGNSSQAEGEVDTDILVVKDGERYRVAVSSIVFKGYTADYEDLAPEQVAQNRLTLDRLAAKFARFPDYRIRLIGHAVMINWDDPNLGIPEQEKILIPLSKARAAAIAKALSARGIEASRMIVEGVGATRPLVPDSDLANRWKNRRVEFFLEK